MSDMSGDGVCVHGPATPDEVAAVLAALQLRERRAGPAKRFEQWRRQRLAVLRDNQ
jgi:hypothetical protein